MSDPCTCADCNAKANRIAAFGALRRAAEVIREAERLHLCKYEANYIRRAIRAAIGSDKT